MVGRAVADLRISDLREEDIPAVAEIERISSPVAWSEMLFRNELHNPRSASKVAKKNGVVVGFLCARLVLDEGHILNLAVHPDHRQIGVAAALVEETLRYLAGHDCRRVYLEVRASNTGARSLYERFGFGIVGTRKDFYINPVEDGLLMTLRLGDAGA